MFQGSCGETIPVPEKKPQTEEAEKPVAATKGKKLVALTFDDGPTHYTPRILDILKKYNIKATFFVCGYKVKAHPKIFSQIRDAGHEIAGHSMYHQDFRKLTAKQIKDDFTQMIQLIGKHQYCRFPYGAGDEEATKIAKEFNCTPVTWNADTLDWKQQRSVADVIHTVEREVRPAAPTVILCHCNSKTVASLPKIIDFLAADSLFVAISKIPKDMLPQPYIPNAVKSNLPRKIAKRLRN